jgi:glutaredoxin
LENNSLTYKKIILPSKGTVSNEVKIAFDQKTVPIIFFKREDEKSFELIGGFTDLEKIIYG